MKRPQKQPDEASFKKKIKEIHIEKRSVNLKQLECYKNSNRSLKFVGIPIPIGNKLKSLVCILLSIPIVIIMTSRIAVMRAWSTEKERDGCLDLSNVGPTKYHGYWKLPWCIRHFYHHSYIFNWYYSCFLYLSFSISQGKGER